MNNIHSRRYVLIVQGSMVGTDLPVVSMLNMPETHKIILRRKQLDFFKHLSLISECYQL